MHPAMTVGLGTWPISGSAYGNVPGSAARATIEQALAMGVTLFDTADIYGDGRMESLLGRLLPSHVEIVGKAGYLTERGGEQDFGWTHVSGAVRASLQRLRRSQLDVLLLHSPPRHVLHDRHVRRTFERVLDAGWAGRIGVSLRSVDDGPAALEWSAVSVIEVIANVLDQRALDLGLAAECRQRDVRILARLPLCSGVLSGVYPHGHRFGADDRRSRWPDNQIDAWLEAAQAAREVTTDGDLLRASLHFLVTAGMVPIPGMKSPAQVQRAVEACAAPASSVEFDRLRQLWHDELTSLPPT